MTYSITTHAQKEPEFAHETASYLCLIGPAYQWLSTSVRFAIFVRVACLCLIFILHQAVSLFIELVVSPFMPPFFGLATTMLRLLQACFSPSLYAFSGL